MAKRAALIGVLILVAGVVSVYAVALSRGYLAWQTGPFISKVLVRPDRTQLMGEAELARVLLHKPRTSFGLRSDQGRLIVTFDESEIRYAWLAGPRIEQRRPRADWPRVFEKELGPGPWRVASYVHSGRSLSLGPLTWIEEVDALR